MNYISLYIFFNKKQWKYYRQIDRQEQSKDNEPSTKTHGAKSPKCLAMGGNWENKNSLAPRVTFLP